MSLKFCFGKHAASRACTHRKGAWPAIPAQYLSPFSKMLSADLFHRKLVPCSLSPSTNPLVWSSKISPDHSAGNSQDWKSSTHPWETSIANVSIVSSRPASQSPRQSWWQTLEPADPAARPSEFWSQPERIWRLT